MRLRAVRLMLRPFQIRTLTCIALLDFDNPRGLRLQISSLAASNFATSYTLGSVGVVDGSVSYLYSSLPLENEFKSSRVDLNNVIRGYRHVQELRRPDEKWWWETWHAGKRVDRKSEDRTQSVLGVS
jgi:distribution and morphology protein 10